MTSRYCLIIISFEIISLLLLLPCVNAYELGGDITFEGSFFPYLPTFEKQEHNSVSVGINGEFYHEFAFGSSVTIAPFLRIDSGDSERTHADLREFNFIYLADQWELKAGISKIFWGAAEFVHLVDIINQTDLVEDISGEEKLGQPMIHLSLAREWGYIDGFVLPFFRERTYLGAEGRLRPASLVDKDKTIYESSAEQNHTDFALRYSQSIGSVDWGVYQFVGTGREPTLIEKEGDPGSSVLVPYYPQISQTGLDVQAVQGEWLWKGEALYRTGQGRSFAALTVGFEYTLYGLFDTQMDAGLIVEYVFDDRDGTVATVYDNDIMAGLRFSFNDIGGSEFLIGIIKDMDLSSTIMSIEASSRIGEAAKIKISGGVFSDMSELDPGYDLRNDDYIKLEVVFYSAL